MERLFKHRDEVKEKLQQRALGLLATASLFVAEKFYTFDLDEESKQRLREVNEELKQGSVIIYANHPSTKDVLVIPLLREHLSNVKKAGIPMAEKYTTPNWQKKGSFGISVFDKLMRVVGVRFLPTHQRGINVEPAFRFLRREKKADRGHRVMEAMFDFLSNGAGNVVGITPTGTRTPEVEGKFRTGLARMMLGNQNVPVVPVAISYEGSRTICLRVGESFSLTSVGFEAGDNKGKDIKKVTRLCENRMLGLLNPEKEV